MILHDNIITLTKESIKKYKIHGAVILQVLYTRYGETIELDVETWRDEGLLDFVTPSAIRSVLTNLKKEGHITIEDNVITILEHRKKVEKKEVSKRVKKKENPVWDMAELICRVTGQQEGLYTQKKYLTFAKKLIEKGETLESMERQYGEGGLWYKNRFKGTKGHPPKYWEIRETVGTLHKSNITDDKKTKNKLFG